MAIPLNFVNILWKNLKKQNTEIKYIELEGKTINPCRECYVCQDISGEYGCAQKDDMAEIAAEILWADVIILATPIFHGTVQQR